MSLWLLLITVLTVQEGVSTTVVLLEAVRAHYSIWLINAIWLFVTVVQTYAGYLLGKWVQKRFANSKAERWFERSAQKLKKSIGERGEELALILASAIVSPAATAFLAAWLDISLIRIFIFVVLGDLMWYALTWATVIGATQVLADVKYGAVIVLIAAIVWLVSARLRRAHS